MFQKISEFKNFDCIFSKNNRNILTTNLWIVVNLRSRKLSFQSFKSKFSNKSWILTLFITRLQFSSPVFIRFAQMGCDGRSMLTGVCGQRWCCSLYPRVKCSIWNHSLIHYSLLTIWIEGFQCRKLQQILNSLLLLHTTLHC